jgi:hypothetical protein
MPTPEKLPMEIQLGWLKDIGVCGSRLLLEMA